MCRDSICGDLVCGDSICLDIMFRVLVLEFVSIGILPIVAKSGLGDNPLELSLGFSKREEHNPLASSLYPNTHDRFINELTPLLTYSKASGFLIILKREEHNPLTNEQVKQFVTFPHFPKFLSLSSI